MLNLMRRHSFLIGLTLAVIIGFGAHQSLAPVAKLGWLKTAIVLAVMSMMSAPVPLDQFLRTAARPWPALLASLLCMGLVPALGWVVSKALPADLAGGLIVACCVPSTLASAAVLTRKAGGDDTVPIFVTILTNLSCVILTPVWLALLLGNSIHLSIGDLMQELLVLVVVPIAAMQFLRWKSLRFCHWANAAKPRLSVACQIGILSMVLLGATQMAGRWSEPGTGGSGGWLSVIQVIAWALAIHLVALTTGWFLSRATRIEPAQAIGVSFAGSQKTLMIGLNLAMDFGVSILPMIAYHVSQLLADAVIAERWRKPQHNPESSLDA